MQKFVETSKNLGLGLFAQNQNAAFTHPKVALLLFRADMLVAAS